MVPLRLVRVFLTLMYNAATERRKDGEFVPRYVVTGGAGFIGSHLAELLAGRGDPVIVLDNLSTGSRENLNQIRGAVDFHEVDLRTAPLPDLLAGVDTVFHQAAIPSVPQSVEDPEGTHDVNVNATLRVLAASLEAGVRRVVYASSCALYGDRADLPVREDAPARPTSPYGAQKYFGEMYMQVYSRVYGLETVSLRYFNVFGPRQDPTSQYSGVIAQFVPAVLTGGTPTIYGDGSQSRDFVYVGDVVEANLRAAEAEGVAGQVFNIAGGRETTVRDTLDLIQAITGKHVDVRYAPSRSGDIRHSRADADLAEQALGWRARTTFREGLERTVDWYRR